MSQNSINLTPMIRQYLEIKKDYQDSILFFRMGDFYEMFFEDAEKASKLLEIVLTSRNRGEENPIPFCGVPHHSASSYIARLIQAGHKVAICEQVEDPETAKGIVKREVVRVITPGLVLETESLDAKQNNYLISLALHHKDYALAFADISTGEMGLALFHDLESLFSELSRRDPKEILCSSSDKEHPILLKLRRHFPGSLIQFHSVSSESDHLLASFSPRFQKAWELASLKKMAPLVERAALRLLDYVHQTLKSEVGHLSDLYWISEKSHLVLDAATVRNLELVRNLQDGRSWGTLLDVLDRTETAMGGRCLKNWILYPLASESEIRSRQQAIAELIEAPEILMGLRGHLSSILDLERQNGRISTGIANARDLVALGFSLQRLPQIETEIKKLSGPFFKRLLENWNNLSSLASKITETLYAEVPLGLHEGNLIRAGIHPELDELRSMVHDGKSTLAQMEERERGRTGISSLKVRYNRVFGYYIEVPQSRKDKVPSDYIRKQTLVNAERFITPELKNYEEKVLGAEGRICQLEYELFCGLRAEIATFAPEIAEIAKKVATLDALVSLAVVAEENNYCCPTFVADHELFIEEGRHPVLEKLFPASRFVPNNLSLNSTDCRLIILTGPNMAGKSTVLRQVALIILMAHMGSYVPAKRVQLGLTDRIFTRIGASDNLSKNQSTFWVEMEEAANILRSATERSLVILDEIGRGTSTYDGLSIAWAIAEVLHDKIKAKTLFATHYHELIELAQRKEGVQNFNIAVKEWNGEILFLYRMVPGGVSQSYGLQVAALAGIESLVIGRAKEILAELQHKGMRNDQILNEDLKNAQMPLFSPMIPWGAEKSAKQIVQQLKDLSLDTLTPLEALKILYDLQEKLKPPPDTQDQNP